jgi:hypothetical protein
MQQARKILLAVQRARSARRIVQTTQRIVASSEAASRTGSAADQSLELKSGGYENGQGVAVRYAEVATVNADEQRTQR